MYVTFLSNEVTAACLCVNMGWDKLLSTGHEKTLARKSTYAHAQYLAMNDEFLLTMLKAFILQVSKQQTIGFPVFKYARHL